jgi:carbonic anhydrase/acetyltransferase-like protein (isoleucine patch superfamily)
MKPLVLPYRAQLPRIAPDAFLAPGVVVVGDVEIGAQASVWFGSVVRGDVQRVRIGARTNLQDGTIVHVTRSGLATLIGSDVTVGHRCVLHACTLEDRAFVGMSATLLDGSHVESDAMVAAGALVTPGTRVLRGQLWGGSPARFMRELKPAELQAFAERAAHYVELAQEYLALLEARP